MYNHKSSACLNTGCFRAVTIHYFTSLVLITIYSLPHSSSGLFSTLKLIKKSIILIGIFETGKMIQPLWKLVPLLSLNGVKCKNLRDNLWKIVVFGWLLHGFPKESPDCKLYQPEQTLFYVAPKKSCSLMGISFIYWVCC